MAWCERKNKENSKRNESTLTKKFRSGLRWLKSFIVSNKNDSKMKSMYSNQQQQCNVVVSPPGTQVIVSPGHQPVVQTVPQATVSQNKRIYARNSMYRCGVIQISMGIIVFILAIILLAKNSELAFFGTGIWTSIFFFISGGFGIQASKTGKSCPTITCLIMSVVSVLAAFIGMGLAAGDLGTENETKDCNYNKKLNVDKNPFFTERDMCDFKRVKRTNKDETNLIIGLLAVYLIAFLIEIAVALIQSCISCFATCCPGNANKGGNVQTTTTTQIVYVPVQNSQAGNQAVNQQQMYYPQAYIEGIQGYPNQAYAQQIYQGQFDYQHQFGYPNGYPQTAIVQASAPAAEAPAYIASAPPSYDDSVQSTKQ